ncbi:MAG: dUTP diphosphatase [Phycisphaerae bacterium]|nr:dUTP diphosphatase [Phycisphaerae bacterium]
MLDGTGTARVEVQRLDERATLPVRKSELAAGFDLAACLPRGAFESGSITLAPGERVAVPTGLALAIPAGFEGQIRPRSGLAMRHGITVVNAPGTIDADYRGELQVALVNLSREAFEISHGDRVAQLVIAAVAPVAFVEASELSETARGVGGFGSTGV